MINGDRQRGVIVMYQTKWSQGKIRSLPWDGRPAIRFHINDVLGRERGIIPRPGDMVTFAVHEGQGGPEAIEVQQI